MSNSPMTSLPSTESGNASVQRGSVYVISAPSGAGKTSLVRALVQSDSGLLISISHTTRSKRPGEINGDHYHFVSQQEFREISERDGFIEDAHVFGNDYGTSHDWVEQQRAAGCDIILEIDWQGARQVKEKVRDSIGIFILPPSLEQLEERLCQRRQDSSDIIRQRMKAAVEEIHHFNEYQYLIINNDFDIALEDLRIIIESQRLNQRRQASKHANLITGLLATQAQD
jgi:guanylate kinase